MPRTLSTGDLKCRTGDIAEALASGQSFLWIEDGRPIAQLTPVAKVASAQSELQAPRLAISLQQMVVWLGEANLSRVLGLTHDAFVEQYATDTFSPPVQDRLTALSSALAEQAAFLPSTRLRAWWFRRHRDLHGRSPIEHLAQPWIPGDAHSATVFQLIHHAYLMHHLPTHSRSRK